MWHEDHYCNKYATKLKKYVVEPRYKHLWTRINADQVEFPAVLDVVKFDKLEAHIRTLIKKWKYDETSVDPMTGSHINDNVMLRVSITPVDYIDCTYYPNWVEGTQITWKHNGVSIDSDRAKELVSSILQLTQLGCVV
jgi:hypothetical protein